MSPTSSSRFFVGRTARSATLRTIPASLLHTPGDREAPGPARSGHSKQSSDRRPNCNRRAGARGTFAAVEGLGSNARRLAAALGATALVLAATGCGGGARQDADEPSGQFEVAIATASFPARQRLAQPERLVVA